MYNVRFMLTNDWWSLVSLCFSVHQFHSWETESASWTHWPPAWPVSGNQYCALQTQSDQQTAGTKEEVHKNENAFACPCMSVITMCLSAHLGLVPVLRFLHVLQGNGLILGPDVPQRTSEIWSGAIVHFHLQLLGLHTHLYFTDFLLE